MPLDTLCNRFILLVGATGSASALLARNRPQRIGNARGTQVRVLSYVVKLLFASITGIASMPLAFTDEVIAQEAGLNAAALAPRESARFLGVDRCERCHQAPTKADIDNRVTDFVLLSESKTWARDIHSRAYELIDPATSSLSKQICDKLDIADISQAQQCLSCHSNWLRGGDRPPTYQRGVACESCHGPSEHWDVPHSRADWRSKPVAEKSSLHMVDVRNPVERAVQCFGCHIGNAAEGKLVTHQIYAAGHPPLPGIEMESFAAQMPRHWRYIHEKVADARANPTEGETDRFPFAHFQKFLDENHKYLHLEAGNSTELILRHHHRSAAVVLGGVVALRESIELLRDLSADGRPQEQTWPELASFDCRACHHELTTPSRRQGQRAGSVPGRPMIASWPTALVRLAIRHVSSDRGSYDRQLGEFQTKLKAVQSELERSPFGSPSRVNAACAELSDWLTDEVVARVSAKPFDDLAVADAINVLIVIGGTEQHDYDSARQIAWALRILSCDASTDSARGTTINELLEMLAPELRLNLPNSPAHSCPPVFTVEESVQLMPLATELPQALAAAIEFDSDRFRQQMQKLRESLR
jgi:hypothetical protein